MKGAEHLRQKWKALFSSSKAGKLDLSYTDDRQKDLAGFQKGLHQSSFIAVSILHCEANVRPHNSDEEHCVWSNLSWDHQRIPARLALYNKKKGNETRFSLVNGRSM